MTLKLQLATKDETIRKLIAGFRAMDKLITAYRCNTIVSERVLDTIADTREFIRKIENNE